MEMIGHWQVDKCLPSLLCLLLYDRKRDNSLHLGVVLPWNLFTWVLGALIGHFLINPMLFGESGVTYYGCLWSTLLLIATLCQALGWVLYKLNTKVRLRKTPNLTGSQLEGPQMSFSSSLHVPEYKNPGSDIKPPTLALSWMDRSYPCHQIIEWPWDSFLQMPQFLCLQKEGNNPWRLYTSLMYFTD